LQSLLNSTSKLFDLALESILTTEPEKRLAGYSKTPLIRKLGIKENTRTILINRPQHYLKTLGSLPTGVLIAQKLSGKFDFIQFFTKEAAELERRFPRLAKALNSDGMLWISWPKKASKVQADVHENQVREIGLSNGLVDVKICAVDEIWSGLKFVFRLEDRK